MPRQSTRHKYRTRREKNQEARRIARIILFGGLVIGLALIFRYWERVTDSIKIWMD